MTKAADWHEVDRDHHSAFQRVFNAHPGVSDVAADCPVCSHATLHRFYLVEMERPKVILGETYKGPGRLWQWCPPVRASGTTRTGGYLNGGRRPTKWTKNRCDTIPGRLRKRDRTRLGSDIFTPPARRFAEAATV